MTQDNSPAHHPSSAGLVDADTQFLLLHDVLPHGGRALLLGSYPHSVISLVSSRARQVTLVDSSSVDAAQWPNVTVQPQSPEPAPVWDVVVAVSDDLVATGHSQSPSAMVDEVLGQLAPGGTAVLSVRNPTPLVDLTDENATAPVGASHVPFLVTHLAARLAAGDKGPVATLSLYGRLGTTAILLEGEGADVGGHWKVELAARASGTSRTLAQRLAAYSLTWTLAHTWVGIIGGRGASAYAKTDAGWARGELEADSGQWTMTPLASGLPSQTVADGPSVETALRDAIVAGDHARFRAVARALGNFAKSTAGAPPLDFRELYIGNGTVTRGYLSTSTDLNPPPSDLRTSSPGNKGENASHTLAASWSDFGTRVGDVRAPWEEVLSARARLDQWLVLSGVDRLAHETEDVEEADLPVLEQLRSAIARRDSQLRHREEYIRGLRRQWSDMQAAVAASQRELAALRSSPALRRGLRIETISSPRALSTTVTKRGLAIARRAVRVTRNRL